jgi:hypothetical protein
VLSEVHNTAGAVNKSKLLRHHNSLGLRDFLKGSFDDNIQWLIPKGEVPYTPFDMENIEGIKPAPFDKLSIQLGNFVVGQKSNMSSIQKEGAFIKLLERIHPLDAEYVVLMKDKKMAGVIKGLTVKVITAEFPDLISK